MADRNGDNLSYSDQKRRIFLIVATLLLMAAMCVALVLKPTLFTSPWIAISAFLLPAIECLLALLFLNQVRSSKAFLIFALALSIATISSATSVEVFVVICCVNIVWGGLFQLGLDLASFPLQFPDLYCVITVIFIPMVWPWAFPVPVFLTAAMTVLKKCSADAAGAGDGGGEEQADAAGGEGEV